MKRAKNLTQLTFLPESQTRLTNWPRCTMVRHLKSCESVQRDVRGPTEMLTDSDIGCSDTALFQSGTADDVSCYASLCYYKHSLTGCTGIFFSFLSCIGLIPNRQPSQQQKQWLPRIYKYIYKSRSMRHDETRTLGLVFFFGI